MKKGNMLRDFDAMVIQYLSGSTSDEEDEVIEKWLNESSDNLKYFNELQNLYLLTKISQNSSGFNKDAGWSRIKAGYYEQRFNTSLKESKMRLKKTFWWIAASFAAVMALGILLNRLVIQKHFVPLLVDQEAYNEVIAPIGSRVSQILLSDGTQVWLNAGSRLRYPSFFDGEKRHVFLEGEAFFDVTDGKQIFIVQTSELDIKVYGTKFNVKSYPEEDLIETTLVEGSLSIETNRGSNRQETLMIEPNQKVTYFKSKQIKPITDTNQIGRTAQLDDARREASEEIIVIPEIDPLPITSWKDPEWIFVREPLDQLTVKLERRYNVKIIFEDEEIKNYKFNGRFRNETFEQILGILKFGAPITYSINKNHVTLREDPSFKPMYDTMISDPN